MALPVRCQSRGNVSPRDLRHNITPEKRAMNHSHCFRVPIKLCLLGMGNEAKY